MKVVKTDTGQVKMFVNYFDWLDRIDKKGMTSLGYRLLFFICFTITIVPFLVFISLGLLYLELVDIHHDLRYSALKAIQMKEEARNKYYFIWAREISKHYFAMAERKDEEDPTLWGRRMVFIIFFFIPFFLAAIYAIIIKFMEMFRPRHIRNRYDLWQKAKEISTENQAIKAIREDHHIFKYLTKFHSNIKVVKVALYQSTLSIKYASKNLRDNSEVINYMICQYKRFHQREGFKYVSKRLRNQRCIAAAAVEYNIQNLKYLNKKIKSDKTFLKTVLQDNKDQRFDFELTYIPKRLRSDREILRLIISNKPRIIFHYKFKKATKLDLDLFLSAVDQDPSIYLSLPEHIKAERPIVMAAINGNWRNKLHPSADSDFSSVLIKKASEIFKNDLGIAEAAMIQGLHGYKYFSATIKKNKPIALLAIKNDTNNYKYTGKDLKKDSEIIDLVYKRGLKSAHPHLDTANIKLLLKNGVAPELIYKYAKTKQRRLKFIYIDALNTKPELIQLEKTINCLLKLDFSALNLNARRWCFWRYKTLIIKSKGINKLDILEIANLYEQTAKKMLIPSQDDLSNILSNIAFR